MQTARDMQDFTSFGGAIVAGVYQFPTLHYTDSMDHTRHWTIRIRLVSGQDVVPIKAAYLKSTPVPAGVVAQYWTESGVVGGKTLVSAATTAPAKNVGRSNERDSLRTALIVARAAYLKAIDRGRRPAPEAAGTTEATPETGTTPAAPGASTRPTASPKNMKIYPMLARNYADYASTLAYPLFIQPKLDGVRAVIYLNAPPATANESNVVIYSRGLKEYPGFPHMRAEILPRLQAMWKSGSEGGGESLYLDGELYEHGKSLQYITGAVRNVSRNSNLEVSAAIKYHMFDAFYPSALGTPFSERMRLVDQFFGTVAGAPAMRYVERVPTWTVKSAAEADALYERLLKQHYEGAMYRVPTAPYLGSAISTSMALRSQELLRRKGAYSDEFEVVGYASGEKGKDVGAIIWVCKTAAGATFNAVPKDMPYAERRRLFGEAQAAFDTTFKGRKMTVEYQDLSDDGTPLRAKATTFRDYE